MSSAYAGLSVPLQPLHQTTLTKAHIQTYNAKVCSSHSGGVKPALYASGSLVSLDLARYRTYAPCLRSDGRRAVTTMAVYQEHRIQFLEEITRFQLIPLPRKY